MVPTVTPLQPSPGAEVSGADVSLAAHGRRRPAGFNVRAVQ
jgi:hypothetical protein